MKSSFKVSISCMEETLHANRTYTGTHRAAAVATAQSDKES